LVHKLAITSAVAIAAIAAVCFANRDANALSYRDILGNWCSATARLEFSRSTMGVFLFASKSHSTTPVTKYEFVGSTVTVYWMKEGKETSSDFSEFSADGRTMFLQPAEDVPRREYSRCYSMASRFRRNWMCFSGHSPQDFTCRRRTASRARM
jgi:hypothetical protein